jgi:hypothetical protein
MPFCSNRRTLFKPENSLTQQSLRAQRSRSVTNGDGFGVGWVRRTGVNTIKIGLCPTFCPILSVRFERHLPLNTGLRFSMNAVRPST